MGSLISLPPLSFPSSDLPGSRRLAKRMTVSRFKSILTPSILQLTDQLHLKLV